MVIKDCMISLFGFLYIKNLFILMVKQQEMKTKQTDIFSNVISMSIDSIL